MAYICTRTGGVGFEKWLPPAAPATGWEVGRAGRKSPQAPRPTMPATRPRPMSFIAKQAPVWYPHCSCLLAGKIFDFFSFFFDFFDFFSILSDFYLRFFFRFFQIFFSIFFHFFSFFYYFFRIFLSLSFSRLFRFFLSSLFPFQFFRWPYVAPDRVKNGSKKGQKGSKVAKNGSEVT